eukprot:g36916.t1
MGPLEDEKGDEISGNEEIAETLNRYFVSVFTVKDTNNLPVINDEETKVGEDLDTIIIMKEVMVDKLMELKVGKSPGLDGIHPRVLKEMTGVIAKALVVIFQNLLDYGAVPAHWKIANVMPLFRKGGRQKMGNYRLVSLISVVGKMLESIIKEKIARHQDRIYPIGQTQHGFTKGRSCLTNLLEFYENIIHAVDNGDPVDVVYLDFQKAFDKVPHKRLLHKIKKVGLQVQQVIKKTNGILSFIAREIEFKSKEVILQLYRVL